MTKLLLTALVVALNVGCSINRANVSLRCEKYTGDELTLRINNPLAGNAERALQLVIERVLYSGISSSEACSFVEPIIYPSNQDSDKLTSLKKELFKSGKYRDFITDSQIDSSGRLTSCTINKAALSEWLIRNSMIKRLDDGF